MITLLNRGARQLPGIRHARTAFASVLGQADPGVRPLFGPADAPVATPTMGASRIAAPDTVMGLADPAADPVLGRADSPAVAPLMSARR
jgi:hypothetical protein